MNQFRPNSFKLLPDVVKNLLIINILFYIGTIILYNRLDIDLTELLGLHMIGSSKFEVYQFVTYMFLHDPNNFSHILFNMFALWMFGNAIENTWGSKRFLIYYLVTGIGAAIIQYAVFYFELRPALELFDSYLQYPNNQALVTLFNNNIITSNGNTEIQMLISNFTEKYNVLIATEPEKAIQLSVEFMQQYRADYLSLPTVIGASGAVFGLLLAFGMMFPNSVIYIYFLIPLKAKYFVIIYGALELFMGFSGSQSNVAHFAHLGGMLFGLILILFWKKNTVIYKYKMSVFGNEINRFIKSKSILNRLMLINIVLFLTISIISVIGYLTGLNSLEKIIVYNLAVPASLNELLYKPWTLFTYMFLQEDFFHVLFNMIMLYFGGKLFSDLLGERRLLAVYILGGLAGAILFIASFNIFPVFQNTINSSIALGASASVLAVFVAVATYMPDMQITLFIFGNIKLKWVALIMVVLDFINIKNGNAGGHIAHIGGAIFGLIYTLSLQKGIDLSKGINKFFESLTSLFKPKPKIKVAYKKTKSDAEYNTQKKVKQQQIDAILDKISKSGYDSLTKEEKDILFKISKENF